MKIYLTVKNFGKIEYAKVDISNFTVFVGNNNSGKTYMMHLIYGILQNLSELRKLRADIFDNFENKIILDDTHIKELVKNINDYLEENKSDIVRNIFHKDIDAELLEIGMELEKDCVVTIISKKEKISPANNNDIFWVEFIENRKNEPSRKRRYGFVYEDAISINDIKYEIMAELVKFIFGVSSNRKNLYLPASRTGMLLLYKYFFSEKDKMNNTIIQIDDKDVKENELGLTAPVYDFLQFLLRYSPNENHAEDNKELLEFINEYLIDGKLYLKGEEALYQPKDSNDVVPLYLSSSMVNELTPLVKALTGASRHSYFMYDEIENCLHPHKQQEMARLLNRINNRGIRLIVSTHSDTMAVKLNNLFLLSFDDDKESRAEKLKRVNLHEEDLLKSKNVSVYQFINKANGKSEVKELEFRKVPYTGYDFSLFTQNSIDLYEEAKIIVEDK